MAASKGSKPKAPPPTPFPSEKGKLHRDGDWLWLPLKKEWRNVVHKPEEIVRQGFIRHLHDSLGYSLDQMDQERRVMSGSRSARADIVVWGSAADMSASPPRTPVLVVECKAELVDIDLRDYWQGESYTRAVGCDFFVATNSRFTAIFYVVKGLPGEFQPVSEFPRATDWGEPKRIEDIKKKLRAFNRKEFQTLLSDCHDILRSNHKMEPGIAFDTISKVLFIKMFVERTGAHGTFTTDYLDQRAATRLKTEAPVHDALFDETKRFYLADELFAEADKLGISEETFRRIVKKLERFDLSRTSDDIKGIAFEKFLGNTFKGDLGQFFTPRPVVDFMVDLLDPEEGELVCDPAAGSGGFLIRTFDHVRSKIADDLHRQKTRAKTEIEGRGLPEDDEVGQIEAAFAEINKELLTSDDDGGPTDTRVGRLAWNCIFGCDAEARAARTAKMNMIMHGDGHGGIYHHDGFVDHGGIFPGRFDLILSNPPFGATVGDDQRLNDSRQTTIPDDLKYRKACEERYGEAWVHSYARSLEGAKRRERILDLFTIGRGKGSRDTEVLFVERCLELLRPGGRMGIVLPDGNLNNPQVAWLRRWVEGKARILAVVSLPDETFRAVATVKASVVFLRRYTEAEEAQWEAAWEAAHSKLDGQFDARRDALCREFEAKMASPNEEAAEALTGLAALGIHPASLGWESGEPPAYPRAVGATSPCKLAFVGEPTDLKAAREVLKNYRAAMKAAADSVRKTSAALRDKLRLVDAEHTAALWSEVKATINYPVFMAAPKAVGITGTGDTGEGVQNDLPEVLSRYREFVRWTTAGMAPETAPEFAR